MDIALVVGCFNGSGLDGAIVHADTTVLAQASISENVGQDLEPEHSRTKNEDEDMATDIMAASPRATSNLAGSMSQDFSGVAHLVLLVVVDRVILVDDLALSAGQSKTAVDDGRAEEPLGNCTPDSGHGSIADDGADTAGCEGGLEARTKRGVGEAEEEESACYPDPANLDKVDVEDVGLEGEVRGSDGWRMRLKVAAVGSVARGLVQDAEQGAQDQSEGIDGQQDALEEGGIPW